MRKIICESNEMRYEFGLDGFSPFILAKVDGLYSTDNNLKITKNAMTDGGTFQGSTAKVRNIVLTVMTPPNDVYRQVYRDQLYRLFSKKSEGKLTYIENGVSRYIHYRVESIKMSAWDKRTYTVSLLCADPFFYSEDDVNIELASWDAGFEFIHEFVSQGEELGTRSAQLSETIRNDTGAEGIGLVITIKCIGAVTNPTITKSETQETIAVGTTANPLNLIYGDIVTISTGDNKKHVLLTRSGVTTNINQYISEDTEFIQLDRGDNTISYGAASGDENMQVTIAYTPTFEGA